MLSGDNGVLQRATDAKTKSDEAQIKERIQLAELSARTDGKGDLAYSKLNEELTKEFGAKGTGYTISDENAEIWTIKVGNVEYNIENSTHVISTGEKLTDIVKTEDYGKTTDYSVTVSGKTLNNWKIFLNDNNNVYIIMGEYLDANLVQDITGIETDTTNYRYGVWHNGNREPFLNALLTSNNWLFLVSELSGATATGTPTIEQLEASYGQASLEYGSVSGELYVLPQSDNGNCDAYWIASPEHDDDFDLWAVSSNGELYFGGASERGLRPLIKLPADSTGKIVNGIVKIDK